MIPAKPQYDRSVKLADKRMKVAAYCRVSTELEQPCAGRKSQHQREYKVGVVRRFEKGQVIVNHNKFMGYTKNEKGELVIVPEEAEIVRTVFRLYLEGYSAAKISAHL